MKKFFAFTAVLVFSAFSVSAQQPDPTQNNYSLLDLAPYQPEYWEHGHGPASNNYTHIEGVGPGPGEVHPDRRNSQLFLSGLNMDYGLGYGLGFCGVSSTGYVDGDDSKTTTSGDGGKVSLNSATLSITPLDVHSHGWLNFTANENVSDEEFEAFLHVETVDVQATRFETFVRVDRGDERVLYSILRTYLLPDGTRAVQRTRPDGSWETLDSNAGSWDGHPGHKCDLQPGDRITIYSLMDSWNIVVGSTLVSAEGTAKPPAFP